MKINRYKGKRINIWYKECTGCPYKGGNSLLRQCVPIKIEDNGSDILLIFQAPGINELINGKAVQPTTVVGGSAGKRILNSWNRTGKSRVDFDIVEAVRCYPGANKQGRDKKPVKAAKQYCLKSLEREINQKQYSKIIAFGIIAQKMVKSISRKYACQIIDATHPNGGCSNNDLDGLW